MTTLAELRVLFLSTDPLMATLGEKMSNLQSLYSRARNQVFDPNFSSTFNPDSFLAVDAPLYFGLIIEVRAALHNLDGG